jgi:hypothetical protein
VSGFAAGSWYGRALPLSATAAPAGARREIRAADYAHSPNDPAGIVGAMRDLSLSTGDNHSELVIRVGRGEFAYNRQILVDVSGNARVRISGHELTPLGTANSCVVHSKAAGEHDVTFIRSGGEWAGVKAGDYVDISKLAPVGAQMQLEGIWRVVEVGGARLTIRNTSQNSDLSMLVISAAVIRRYNTVIKATGADIRTIDPESGQVLTYSHEDPGLFEVLGTADIELENIAIVDESTDADSVGVMLRRGGQRIRLNNCGIHGFHTQNIWCLFQSYAELNRTKVCAAGRDGAVVQFGAGMIATGCVFNGNASSGLRARNFEGYAYAPFAIACGNATGVSSEGPSLTITKATIAHNKRNNCRLTRGSRGDLRGSNLTGAGAGHTQGYGLLVESNSFAEVDDSTVLGGTAADLRVTNAYIHFSAKPPLYTTYNFENAVINGLVHGAKAAAP